MALWRGYALWQCPNPDKMAGTRHFIGIAGLGPANKPQCGLFSRHYVKTGLAHSQRLPMRQAGFDWDQAGQRLSQAAAPPYASPSPPDSSSRYL